MATKITRPRLVRNISPEGSRKFHMLMNPPMRMKDMRYVSGLMGFKSREIDEMYVDPVAFSRVVLQRWMEKKVPEPTVGDLIKLIEEVERHDVLKELRKEEFEECTIAIQESATEASEQSFPCKTASENIDLSSVKDSLTGIENGFAINTRNPTPRGPTGGIVHHPPQQRYPNPMAMSNGASVRIRPQPDVIQRSVVVPSDKIALVIGNQTYKGNKQLYHSLKDAKDVTHALMKLGFKVLCLFDLTLEEMRTYMIAFSSLIDIGVFSVFFFSGHGFETNGENYLVPVDCDDIADRTKCIRSQEILLEMQLAKSLFNLLILDMCKINIPGSYRNCPVDVKLQRQATGNTIIAHSCSHIAYELKCHDNSIYTRELLKHIHRDDRIENILMDINTAVNMNGIVEQRPTFQTDACSDCRLTTPIQARDVGYCKRRLNWMPHQETPEDIVLAEEPFSAIMQFNPDLISHNFIDAQIVLCEVASPITDLTVSIDTCKPLVAQVEQGKLDCLSPTPSQVVVKIWGLQKLRESLLLVIDIAFTCDGQRDNVSCKIDLRMPLVAHISHDFHVWLAETAC